MDQQDSKRGRLLQAPENFLSTEGRSRRRALGGLLAGGAALLAGGSVSAAEKAVAAVDPKHLPPNLPPWSQNLGKPVGADPYGFPSSFEKNIIRRSSPGLTTTTQSSVAFAPLQNLFGIITPLAEWRHNAEQARLTGFTQSCMASCRVNQGAREGAGGEQFCTDYCQCALDMTVREQLWDAPAETLGHMSSLCTAMSE